MGCMARMSDWRRIWWQGETKRVDFVLYLRWTHNQPINQPIKPLLYGCMSREQDISTLGSQLNQSMADTVELRERLSAATQTECDAEERCRQVTATYDEKVREISSTYDERLAALERTVQGRDDVISDLRVQLTNASHIEKLLKEEVESVQQRLAKTLTMQAATNTVALQGSKDKSKGQKKSRPWFWFILPWEW